MAGLVPAIHVFGKASKTWMPGTRPGMTRRGLHPLPDPNSNIDQAFLLKFEDKNGEETCPAGSARVCADQWPPPER
jgi:hypothetical protein